MEIENAMRYRLGLMMAVVSASMFLMVWEAGGGAINPLGVGIWLTMSLIAGSFFALVDIRNILWKQAKLFEIGIGLEKANSMKASKKTVPEEKPTKRVRRR